MYFQVKSIIEDVEDYVESNQDPDFQENEEIYDELGDLDEIQQLQSNPVSAPDHMTDDARSSGTPLALSNSHTSGHSGSTSPPSGSAHHHTSASHLISPNTGSANHSSKGGDDSTSTSSSSRKHRKSESHNDDVRQ